jgi:hypothetical protein
VAVATGTRTRTPTGDGEGDADTDADTDTDTDADTDTDTDADPACTVLTDENADAGMSIWMSSPSDVWIVGADGAGDPGGPMMYHFDGTSWTDHETGLVGKLQWVWSDGGDEIWAVGAGAKVVRYSRSADTFDIETIGDGNYTLWGLWGPSTSDLWAVAGDNFGNLPGAIFHYDGTSWSLAYEYIDDETYQLFKVWGRAADDVWVVGSNGLSLHWDGAAWTRVPDPSGTEVSLFTVHGDADEVIAVGGFANAAVWRSTNGTSWVDDTPPPQAVAPNFTGTFTHPTHGTVACGRQQAIWWREGDNDWAPDGRTIDTPTKWDFHACWIDDDGGVWAAGGNIASPSLDHGQIVYCGDAAIPAI